MFKQCTTCLEYKPLTEFHNSNKGSFGVTYTCKLCVKKKSALPENKERARRRKKKWKREEIPLTERTAKYIRMKRDMHVNIMLSTVKTRAKKRGLEFNLELDDIVIPEYCPILGIKLGIKVPYSGTKHAPQHNSPSVDRLNPEKGYTKDNIVVCSYRANMLKSNATKEELRKILDFLEKTELDTDLVFDT